MSGKTTKRAALYLRVSTTNGQTTANQRRVLMGAAKLHGWKVAAVFDDTGVSGAKGRDKRPGLDKMMSGIARREFDIVAAWSVDRLGRSLGHLVSMLEELKAKGIGLYLHQEGIDTSTPGGKALFQMAGVFAEFERAVIRERVLAGLARAREEGRVGGRPRVDADTEEAIKQALKAGKGIGKVAREVGVGTSVVQRIAAEGGR